MMQGLELDDFVSGPRELLLKLVEENYPLPPKPDPVSGCSQLLFFAMSEHHTHFQFFILHVLR